MISLDIPHRQTLSWYVCRFESLREKASSLYASINQLFLEVQLKDNARRKGTRK